MGFEFAAQHLHQATYRELARRINAATASNSRSVQGVRAPVGGTCRGSLAAEQRWEVDASSSGKSEAVSLEAGTLARPAVAGRGALDSLQRRVWLVMIRPAYALRYGDDDGDRP